MTKPGFSERLYELRDWCEGRRLPISIAWQNSGGNVIPTIPRSEFGKAVVADTVGSLLRTLDHIREEKPEPDEEPAFAPNRLAFVYPGLGNQFAGMGRTLAATWPEVLDRQDLETRYLCDSSLIPTFGGEINCPARSATIDPRSSAASRSGSL